MTTAPDMETEYQEFMDGWRSFNYVFLVVFPDEQYTQVVEALGDYADNDWANQRALDIALDEAQRLSGNDLFFSWYNIGTSHVNLFQYVDAAFAYDYAFTLYDQLENDDTSRPYRIMWYQTGPYFGLLLQPALPGNHQSGYCHSHRDHCGSQSGRKPLLARPGQRSIGGLYRRFRGLSRFSGSESQFFTRPLQNNRIRGLVRDQGFTFC